jgi:ADP-ribose pyrophosphatase YjhB (NUDIX family)
MKKGNVVLQVGVKILLRNRAGKFLLLHRSATAYPNVDGRWDMVGGRITPGTSLLDNLRREVKEETGLKISGKPVLVAAQDVLRVPGNHVVRLTYVGTSQGSVHLDAKEHDEFAWFTPTEILNLADFDVYGRTLLTKKFFQTYASRV